MIEAPPPPVLSAAPVSFGSAAVGVGPRTWWVEVRAGGRITGRRHVRLGARRVSVPLPLGVHAVRVRAVGPGGGRWSRMVRTHVLPASARRAGRVPGFVDPVLQRGMERVAARLPAVGGVYVQHLVTGCGAAVNAGARFPGASTLKAAILVDAVRRGRARELADTLDAMVLDSSDRAANAALVAIGEGSAERGGASVTATLRDVGLGRSLVRRGYIIEDARRGLPIRAEEQPALFTNFVTTPYELARLMVAVHRGAVGRGGIGRLGIGPASARREVLGRLLDVRDGSKLAARVPAGVAVAHKSGFTDEVKHDAGLLYVRRGPIVAVAMSWSAGGVSDATGNAFAAEVGRLATRQLAGGGRCEGLPLR